jgi:aldehyde dehydrogenase (NAD+)
MTGLSFGGGCVNNTAWHLANDALPFGGVGNSGFGNYHGKYSFDTFTREKSVMETPVWPDPDLKYPPFKNKKKLLKFFMK